MSEKIWFVYITDHHEGPFALAEVQAKITEGIVSAESLVWRDGMPEWVQLDSVAELQALLGGNLGQATESLSIEDPEAPQTQEAIASDSLAVEATESEAVSPLDLVEKKQAEKEEKSASLAVDASDFNEEERVWLLRQGDKVSGLFSAQEIAGMIQSGSAAHTDEVAQIASQQFSALTENPNITNATALTSASLPEAAEISTNEPSHLAPGAAREESTQPKIGRSPFMAAPAGAFVGDDEPTDPGIDTEEQFEEPKQGFFGKITGLFKRKKKASESSSAKNKKVNSKNLAQMSARTSGTNPVFKKGDFAQAEFTNPTLTRPNMRSSAAADRRRKKTEKTQSGAKLRIVVYGLVLISLLGGGGTYWYLFMYTPLGQMDDVHPSVYEQMKQVVRASGAPQLFFADAVGDKLNPTFYVATNLAPGTVIEMNLQGIPGSLLNSFKFEKMQSASVTKQQVAKFGPLENNGKPLPMGNYNISFTAGSVKIEKKDYFIGNKVIYNRRFPEFKEKVQKQHDDEITEIREIVTTVKSAYEDFLAKLRKYQEDRTKDAAKATAIWTSFKTGQSTMIQQMKINLDGAISSADVNTRNYLDKLKDLVGVIDSFDSLREKIERANYSTTDPEVVTMMTQIETTFKEYEDFIADASMADPFEAALQDTSSSKAQETAVDDSSDAEKQQLESEN